MEQRINVSRYASAVYRMGNRFYDRELARDGIGCGQQFFLHRLYEQPGQGVLDLAKMGSFDKGTAARAVQKLEELGLLRREEDERDRRSQRLYTTEAAKPVIAAVCRTVEKWNGVLTQGMTEAEAAEAERLLSRMADNAYRYMEREEHAHETEKRA